jgi:hypothetical protein
LAINAFQTHNTLEVIEALQNLKTTVSLILSSCTSFVQVLDIVLNQLIKMLIKQEADNHYNTHIKQWTNRNNTIRKWRIMLTY